MGQFRDSEIRLIPPRYWSVANGHTLADVKSKNAPSSEFNKSVDKSRSPASVVNLYGSISLGSSKTDQSR